MKPHNVHKAVTLKPNEEILAVVHESLAAHAPKLVLYLALFLLPFFLMFPLLRLGVPGVVGFFLLLAAVLALCGRYAFRWANTVLVITDRRVIDVDQRALFDRVVSDAPYGLMDDVTYRIKGILPTLCRFGSIRIQMSGSAADLEFHRADGPARIHDLVNDLRKVLRDEEEDRKQERVRKLAERMSDEDVEALEGEYRRKERDEALHDLYEDEDAEGT